TQARSRRSLQCRVGQRPDCPQWIMRRHSLPAEMFWPGVRPTAPGDHATAKRRGGRLLSHSELLSFTEWACMGAASASVTKTPSRSLNRRERAIREKLRDKDVAVTERCAEFEAVDPTEH